MATFRQRNVLRCLAVVVSLSFVPQLVSPAFARDVSLRWAVGWLMEEAAGDELLVGALEGARDSMPAGNAIYLAAVIASYSAELEASAGAGDGRLLGEIASKVVAFCAPQVAPPSAVSISIASLGKDAPTRTAALDRSAPVRLTPRSSGCACDLSDGRHGVTLPPERPECAQGP